MCGQCIRDVRGSICAGLKDVELPTDLAVCNTSGGLRASVGLQELLGSLSSSELSSHQMAIRGRPGVQEMLGTLIPSELSSHQMAIRSHLGVRPPLSNTLRRIWADWMSPLRAASTHNGFRSRQGCSPARHEPLLVPLPISAFSRSLLVPLHMRARQWTP